MRLRPYKDCDAEVIVRWLTDETMFWKWCAGRYAHFPVTAEEINDFYRQSAQDGRCWQMTMLDGTEVKGHLLMQFLDEAMTELKFGCIIVDSEVRGKGYGHQMLTLALHYAFEMLEAEQVSLGVFDNNPAARRCYERLGFTEDGTYEWFHLMGEDWKFRKFVIKKEDWMGEKRQ